MKTAGKGFKKGILKVLLLMTVIFTFVLASCSSSGNTRKQDESAGRPKDGGSPSPGQNGGGGEAGTKKTVYEPPVSGAVASVPWENDGQFRKKQEQSKAPVRMAAFRTVLHDPLPGEEHNVHLAARLLAGTVLEPGEIFSQNDKIGPYIESKGFKRGPTYAGPDLITSIGGGVCKISSTLYNVTILCNLEVIERHPHVMPVPYVPYGQDATVSYGARDFRFRNTLGKPLLIWAQGVDNTLYIAFYGSDTPPKVTWHHEKLQIKKAPVIYHTNTDLPPGTEKTVQEGMDGAVVHSWVTIENPDRTTAERQLGKSRYEPMVQIIEKSK